MTSETILITGGAGYIGSHCCRAVAQQGLVPLCFDDLSTGRRDFVRFGPFEQGDVRDAARIKSVIEQYHPRTVIHLAARIEVEESVREPLLYYDVNLGGTLALLKACADSTIERLIFSSTAAVYGSPAASPVALSAATEPINPYGQSKLMAEQVLTASAERTGLDITCLRYFNVAGSARDSLLGQRPEHATHLIPRALTAAARDTEMSVYGTDYATPDGTAVRDYIHVSDLVSAHLAVLKAPPVAGRSRIYNVGIGRGFSVLEVLDAVERVLGRRIRRKLEGRRAGDAPETVAGDTDRARRELSWEPQHTDLDGIIADAWQWHSHAIGVPESVER